jgi:hypothetical protein
MVTNTLTFQHTQYFRLYETKALELYTTYTFLETYNPFKTDFRVVNYNFYKSLNKVFS